MDLEQLKNIITIFEFSSLCELEIEERGVRFRLVKKVSSPETSIPEFARSKEIEVTPTQEQPEKVSDKEVIVRSPLVGTFYRAHSPGEEPFTETGEHIHPGQTLCVIEAMKVMNEISSEVSGNIKKILVENGQPVEYDQELFIIERED
ncbi:acetyl-CoA carboxylase biotin carboxyl carrier protein [Candidatus Aerophobetes bacterium]|nr:acetyl-CoA carboxylase biotin carboxyl carrier protein [Candidatus Aerophobetes bacterium]